MDVWNEIHVRFNCRFSRSLKLDRSLSSQCSIFLSMFLSQWPVCHCKSFVFMILIVWDICCFILLSHTYVPTCMTKYCIRYINLLVKVSKTCIARRNSCKVGTRLLLHNYLLHVIYRLPKIPTFWYKTWASKDIQIEHSEPREVVTAFEGSHICTTNSNKNNNTFITF